MCHHLRQLRGVQIRLLQLQDGLEAKANDLGSPYVDLLVDELKQASMSIDRIITELEIPKMGLSGGRPVSDYDQIMTDGL